MRTISSAYLVLVCFVASARSDNPAPHLSNASHAILDPAYYEQMLAAQRPIARCAETPDLPIIEVHVCSTEVNNALVIALAKLPSLRSICAMEVSEDELQRLFEVRQVRKFWLGSSTVNTAHMMGLGSLQRLEKLTFHRCEISDGALDELCGLTRLKVLSIEACPLNVSKLAKLAELREIGELSLNWSQITDAEFKAISRLPKLERLELFACEKITGAGLKQLKSCELLWDLDLRGCSQLTDKDCRALLHLPALRKIAISYCESVTDDGLGAIAQLPSLEELRIENCCRVTDKSLIGLASLKHLRSIIIIRCDKITESGINKLRHEMPHCEIYYR
jgi:hypothetical protein